MSKRDTVCTECGEHAGNFEEICAECCTHPREERECTTCNVCGETVS